MIPLSIFSVRCTYLREGVFLSNFNNSRCFLRDVSKIYLSDIGLKEQTVTAGNGSLRTIKS